MSGKRLEGKVAIVTGNSHFLEYSVAFHKATVWLCFTGAASGFGKAIAKRFSEEGCHVVLTDLNGDGVAQVTKELNVGDNAVSMSMDVSQEQAWADVVKLTTEKFGKIDILVNNGRFLYHAFVRKCHWPGYE